jgi:hypothetical protein
MLKCHRGEIVKNNQYYFYRGLNQKNPTQIKNPKPISKSILNNSKGNSFLTILIFTSFFLTLSLWTVLKNVESIRLVKERNENYLCVKSQLSYAQSFTKKIGNANLVITVNFPLLIIPELGVVARQIIELTKIFQETQGVLYKGKTLNNQHCSKINRMNFLKLSFYQSHSLDNGFTRDFMERTILSSNKNQSLIYLWNSKNAVWTRSYRQHADKISIKILHKDMFSKAFFQWKVTPLWKGQRYDF